MGHLSSSSRVLYVAGTRARTLLYFLYCTHREILGSTWRRKVSDFISSVKKENPVGAIETEERDSQVTYFL
jgi:superfamily I DNA/RNA helicase